LGELTLDGDAGQEVYDKIRCVLDNYPRKRDIPIPKKLEDYIKDITDTTDHEIQKSIHIQRGSVVNHIINTFNLIDPIQLTALLLCPVNPMMLTLAIATDLDEHTWKSVLLFIPSTENSSTASVIHTWGGTSMSFFMRDVTDADREGSCIGPSIVVELDGVTKTAVYDMCSFSHDQEYIIFGSQKFDTIDIDDKPYTTYRHVDHPLSKTPVPHYRLYSIHDHFFIDDRTYYLPIIFMKCVRQVTSTHKMPILTVLPYVADVRRLSAITPERANSYAKLIYMTLMGTTISPWEVESEIKKSKYTIDMICYDDTYKAGICPRVMYPYGAEWLKCYNEMFS